MKPPSEWTDTDLREWVEWDGDNAGHHWRDAAHIVREMQ